MGTFGPKCLVTVNAKYFFCNAMLGSQVHTECIFTGVSAVTEITWELDTPQVIHLMVTSQVPCLTKNGAANATLHWFVALHRWIQTKYASAFETVLDFRNARFWKIASLYLQIPRL